MMVGYTNDTEVLACDTDVSASGDNSTLNSQISVASNALEMQNACRAVFVIGSLIAAQRLFAAYEDMPQVSQMWSSFKRLHFVKFRPKNM